MLRASEVGAAGPAAVADVRDAADRRAQRDADARCQVVPLADERLLGGGALLQAGDGFVRCQVGADEQGLVPELGGDRLMLSA
jgi:hypothetical protein